MKSSKAQPSPKARHPGPLPPSQHSDVFEASLGKAPCTLGRLTPENNSNIELEPSSLPLADIQSRLCAARHKSILELMRPQGKRGTQDHSPWPQSSC